VTDRGAAVDLYWLPLGAGGHFVRLNGRLYEALAARREKRLRFDLYHSALIVTVPDGAFAIEQAWPVPRGRKADRGVVAEGAVGLRLAGRLRALRYETRRWPDGVVADLDEAVSRLRLTEDPATAGRLLALVPDAPTPVWGRDELGTGEMWNSNSLIAWLILRSGLDIDEIPLPPGGRAPGWNAGIVVAGRHSAATPEAAPLEGSVR
jgi:hypothetical protein